MTNIFHNAVAEPAPADVALPTPVKSEWLPSYSPQKGERQKDVDNRNSRDARRGSIARAVAKANGKDLEKGSDRAALKGDRDVGSAAERASTKSSVAKAMEKAGYVPGREENLAGREELRKAVETLKQRYPGRSASDFVKIAKDWEDGFKKSPLEMREKLLETYASVSPENFKDTPKDAPKQHGPSKPRDSIRRAMGDYANASDLAAFEKEFGGKLPSVLAELVRHDKALVDDPVGTSARLAAAYGSPVTERQQVAYEQKQQVERARQQDLQSIDQAFDMMVKHKVLPGLDDDATWSAMADVLESKDFKYTGNRLEDLKRAHAQMMESRTAAKRSHVGSRSIHGAPSTRQPADARRSAIRNSIERAKRGG